MLNYMSDSEDNNRLNNKHRTKSKQFEEDKLKHQEKVEYKRHKQDHEEEEWQYWQQYYNAK